MSEKLVIITGSSRGIGQGIAKVLCEEGYQVAGIDIRPGDETAQLAGRNFTHFACDLADPTAITRTFAQIDDVYAAAPWGLVYVAGVGPEIAYLDTTPEMFDTVMAINVRGMFFAGQEAGRRMRDVGVGRIINIASTASVQGWAHMTAYGASKGAVLLLTRNMANELAEHGITVNAVGPGTIDTPLAANVIANPDWVASELGRTPIRRFGTPLDIANGVRFFLRDDADWVTGQTLYIDGGFLSCGGPSLPSMQGHRSIDR